MGSSSSKSAHSSCSKFQMTMQADNNLSEGYITDFVMDLSHDSLIVFGMIPDSVLSWIVALSFETFPRIEHKT